MTERDDYAFVIYAHCASGYRETWDFQPTEERAVASAKKALKDSPITDCGTGGIRWCEIFGPEDDTGNFVLLGVERDGRGGYDVQEA